ncbi:MAG: serine O-acetyltransferase [Candidatus Izimaplasma sp.]|nr:serine O-acetyltransferase [Candidatus Izimaplasma bacterium]
MKLTYPIKKILQSYKDTLIEKDHCSCKIPQNSEIIKIIDLTREIIFPGYFSTKNLSELGNTRTTKRIVRRLHRVLKKQIKYALLYLADSEKDKQLTQKSCSLCVDFIVQIPKIREKVYQDVIAHYNGDPAAFNHDQVIISYPGLYAIMIYRIAHELDNLGVKVIPRMMSEYAHRETGIDINPKAKIGNAFFIDHGTGVVIGETAEIGDRVKIYQGVTLGAMSLRKGNKLKGVKRHPTIGNDVTIYANAAILGGDSFIGDNSIIGANVFITGSIPEKSIVTMKNMELETRENKVDESI